MRLIDCLAFQALPYDEETRFSNGLPLCSWHIGSGEVGVYFWFLSSLWEWQSVVLAPGSLMQLPAGTPLVSSICQLPSGPPGRGLQTPCLRPPAAGGRSLQQSPLIFEACSGTSMKDWATNAVSTMLGSLVLPAQKGYTPGTPLIVSHRTLWMTPLTFGISLPFLTYLFWLPSPNFYPLQYGLPEPVERLPLCGTLKFHLGLVSGMTPEAHAAGFSVPSGACP